MENLSSGWWELHSTLMWNVYMLISLMLRRFTGPNLIKTGHVDLISSYVRGLHGSISYFLFTWLICLPNLTWMKENTHLSLSWMSLALLYSRKHCLQYGIWCFSPFAVDAFYLLPQSWSLTIPRSVSSMHQFWLYFLSLHFILFFYFVKESIKSANDHSFLILQFIKWFSN